MARHVSVHSCARSAYHSCTMYLTQVESPKDTSLREIEDFIEAMGMDSADLTLRLDASDGDPRTQRIREGLNALIERFGRDLRDIAKVANSASAGIARNGFFLQDIGSGSADQADRLDNSVATLGQVVESVASVARAAESALDMATDTRLTSEVASAATSRIAADLASTTAVVMKLTAGMDSLMNCVQEMAVALEAIDDVSAQTHLLSINAKIEAAHAGERGRTFAIVADEIAKLARQTKNFTGGIEDLLRTARAEMGELRSVSGAAGDATTRLRSSSSEIEAALATVAESSRKSCDHAAAIAAAAEEQSTALRSLAGDVRDVADRTSRVLRVTAQAKDLRIGDLNSELAGIIGHYKIGIFVERALRAADAAAQEVEAVFEEELARGRIHLEQLLDPVYREVEGVEARALSRLFNPGIAQHFTPPKFATAYDALVDVRLCEIVDRYTDANAEFSAMCMMDINAFHIAHYRAMRADITGDPTVDRANNRVKRMFEDRTSLRCARVGLAGAESLGERIGSRILDQHGISHRRASIHRPYVLQSYARDTGEVFNDLSVALYVRGSHYGALSVAYPADTI